MPGSIEKAIPSRSGSRVAGDDVRVLVALEPDAVAGPVEERLAVALGLDRAARRGVHRFGRDARPNGARRRGLGAVQDAEQVAEPFVRTLGRVAAGHPQRPGDVGAVAADRAADVEDDRLAGLR